MAVGFTAQVDANTINSNVANVVINLKASFEDIRKFKAFLDTRFPTDAELKSFMTYTDADVALLRGVVADLENLRLTAIGQRTQPAASNFFFNADKVTGYR